MINISAVFYLSDLSRSVLMEECETLNTMAKHFKVRTAWKTVSYQMNL